MKLTMPCRIGISMDPDRRLREWERAHPTLRNWRILGCFDSKSAAQAQESLLAHKYNCTAFPGGVGQEVAKWYVYYFEF